MKAIRKIKTPITQGLILSTKAAVNIIGIVNPSGIMQFRAYSRKMKPDLRVIETLPTF